ncbi:MAG: hypothetical protein COB22_08660 [Cycloclasticus sp.]|nr:MAG: hypothetical protein COB22_08660 [Cycloclasticus sp.]
MNIINISEYSHLTKASIASFGASTAELSSEAGEASKDALTPCNNMGGKKSFNNHSLEEKFIHIKHNKGVVVKVPLPDTSKDIMLSLVDWVSFTFKLGKFYTNSSSQEDIIIQLSEQLLFIFGFGITEKRKSGLNFYSDSYEVGVNNFGQVCIGGQNSTCLVTVKGQGLLHSSVGWEGRLEMFLESIEATITRVDLSCDLFYSKYTVFDFLQSYHDGLFTTRSRSPSIEQRGDWVNDNDKGRTLYIGKKQSGKLLRIYEKGKQLGGSFSHLFSDWVRIELELSNKDRTLPYAVLVNSGQYLAGAYPALSFLFEKQSKVLTSKKTTQLDIDRSLAIVRHQFGAYIYAFNELYGSERTIEILTEGKKKIPSRLNAVNDIQNLKNKIRN